MENISEQCFSTSQGSCDHADFHWAPRMLGTPGRHVELAGQSPGRVGAPRAAAGYGPTSPTRPPWPLPVSEGAGHTGSLPGLSASAGVPPGDGPLVPCLNGLRKPPRHCPSFVAQFYLFFIYFIFLT